MMAAISTTSDKRHLEESIMAAPLLALAIPQHLARGFGLIGSRRQSSMMPRRVLWDTADKPVNSMLAKVDSGKPS